MYLLFSLIIHLSYLEYFPRCGHCKRMKPEFEKSAGDLIKNDPPVTLAKVRKYYLVK